MPRYRVDIFVQHDDSPYGCHFSLKVDGRTPENAVGKAKIDAVQICYEYHAGECETCTPQLVSTPIEMKPLKPAVQA
jgi:hypothetical protein